MRSIMMNKVIPGKSRTEGLFRAVLASIVVLNLAPGYSWWQSASENVPIAVENGNKVAHQTVSDGDGGALTVWADNGDWANNGIWAQRVDRFGQQLWGTTGVRLTSPHFIHGWFAGPRVISDGNGGAIIAWYQVAFLYQTNSRTYMQRLDSKGNPVWAFPAILDDSSGGHNGSVDITSDGAGGAIAVWVDSFNDQIRVQRVTSSGQMPWLPTEVRLDTSSANYRLFPRIVSDGAGGAICAWYEFNTPETPVEIHARRVNAAGQPQWAAPAMLLNPGIANRTGSQEPELAADGLGGAILAWEDSRGDVFAQRVNGDGTVLWTVNGVALAPGDGLQQTPVVAADGAGGAVVAWHDLRETDPGIYAQRLNSAGVAQWSIGGEALGTAEGTQPRPNIASAPEGRFVIAWSDARTTPAIDLFAQQLDANGTAQWEAGGVAVTTANGEQIVPEVFVDSNGQATFTWLDSRDGPDYDIYGARLEPDGSLPTYGPCPGTNITFVVDPTAKCKSTKKGTKCKVKAKAIVSNLGIEASAPTTVCFYLSDDVHFDATSDTLLQQRKVKSMKPGKTRNVKLSKKLDLGVEAHGKYILAVIGCSEPIVSSCDFDARIAGSGPLSE